MATEDPDDTLDAELLSVLNDKPAVSEEPELSVLDEQVNAEANDVSDVVNKDDDEKCNSETNKADDDGGDDKDSATKTSPGDDTAEAGKDDAENEEEEDKADGPDDEEEEKEEEDKRQPDRGEIRSRILKAQYEKFLRMAGGVATKKKEGGEAAAPAAATTTTTTPEADADADADAATAEADAKEEGKDGSTAKETDADAVSISAEEMAKLPKFLQVLAKERAVRLKRAKKFGIEFKEPDLRTLKNAQLSAAELRRLAGSVLGGQFSGRAFLTQDDLDKRDDRAAKFNLPPPSEKEQKARARQETMIAEVKAQLEKKRKRGERFGHVDTTIVTCAQQALGRLAPPNPKHTLRDDALYVRGEKGRLPASTEDILHFFRDYSPAWVEWLGQDVNVVFNTAADATRAKEGLGEAVPPAEGIPEHFARWSRGTQPIIKRRGDKWGPAGGVTTVWMRVCTTGDVKPKRRNKTISLDVAFGLKDARRRPQYNRQNQRQRRQRRRGPIQIRTTGKRGPIQIRTTGKRRRGPEQSSSTDGPSSTSKRRIVLL